MTNPPTPTCKRGHLLTEENTWSLGNRRTTCKICSYMRRDGTANPIPKRTHCKKGHSLVDAYKSPRKYVSKKTGQETEYVELICRICALEKSSARNRARGHKSRPTPVMPTDRTIIAYAAGIFDGEGTVGIRLLRKSGHQEKRYHSVMIAVTSTELALTDWLQAHFGGNVNQNHRENAERNYKDAWKWTLFARHAAAFLEAVRPYLIIKEHQARVALELRDEMGNGRNTPITPELFAHRESLRQQLKSLNRRGRVLADTQEEQ